MLNLTEQNRKADPFARVARLLPHLSSVPLYQDRSPRLGSIPDAECPRCAFSDLPFVTKHEMRENFPGNFLRPGQALESLLEQELVELEYTSGTSEERVPVLLGRDWWPAQ